MGLLASVTFRDVTKPQRSPLSPERLWHKYQRHAPNDALVVWMDGAAAINQLAVFPRRDTDPNAARPILASSASQWLAVGAPKTMSVTTRGA